MAELFDKFMEDNIMLSFDDLQNRLEKFPFPAVTFVNEKIMNKTNWEIVVYVEYAFVMNAEYRIPTPYFSFEAMYKDPQYIDK